MESAKHVYRFGSFCLDAGDRLLYRGNQLVPLPPKVFDTLLLLVAGGGRVLTKADLMKRLWPDTFVEEGTLTQYISVLRKALDTDANWIETLPRRGYRFTEPVEESQGDPASLANGKSDVEKRPANRLQAGIVISALLLFTGVAPTVWLWNRGALLSGSVAVLPFKTISVDERLADGIAEALTTRLARVDGLRVVPYSRAQRSKGSTTDAATFGRQLGVDTVIEGTARLVSGTLLLSVHGVDTRSGYEVWADDRFETSAAHLPEAERRLADAVVQRFRHAPSTARSQKGDSESRLALQQHRLYHGGRAGSDLLRASISNANRAFSMNADSPAAVRAIVHIQHSTGRAVEALLLARRALDDHPDDLDAIEAAAEAYFRTGLYDRAADLYRKALEVEPDNNQFRRQLARMHLYRRDYQEGLDALATLPVNEVGPFGMSLFFEAGQQDKAREAIKSFSHNAFSAYIGGCVLDRAGDRAGANALWQEGVKLALDLLGRNENPYPRTRLGTLYAKLGMRERAAEQVDRALAPDRHHPIFLFFSAQVYAILGNRPQAVGLLREAMENGFLNVFMLDYHLGPAMAFYDLRNDPELRSIRAEMARRVEELRAMY